MRQLVPIFLLCVLIPITMHAQVRMTIDSTDVSAYPEVRLKVHVTDGSSNVHGLQVTDFTVFEDGLLMPITGGYCEDTLSRESVSVLLLIDVSSSMDDGNPSALTQAKRAAKSFIDRLQPGDSAALVSFSTQAYYNQPWTADMDLIKLRIDQLRTIWRTALWDAVAMSSNLIRYRTQRKVMILLADGEDNESNLRSWEAINYARAAGCAVFCIGLGRDIEEQALRDLAQQTGGQYFAAPSAAELDQIYADIAQVLESTGICEIRYTSPIDCWNAEEVGVDVEVQTSGGFGLATTSYYLPYDTTTFSYVNLSMEREYVVEAGERISIPLDLTRVSPDRAPSVFEFSVDYDTDLLQLVSAQVSGLTAGYQVSINPTLRGSDLVLSGTTAVTTPGTLCNLVFEAAPVFSSQKSEVGITPPDVQQFCTVASSSNGLITVSGTCERALHQSSGSLQRDVLLGAHPNPVPGESVVRYRLGTDRHVILRLVDTMGNEVLRLADRPETAGEHNVSFDGTALSSGRYFLVFSTGATLDVHPIIIAR